MHLERARLAESFIRGEAIQFMRQLPASHEANKQMVLSVLTSEPEDVPLRSQPSAPTNNLLDELCQKYGFKRPMNPRIVIATPIPSSAQAPTTQPAPPAVNFSKTRFKRTARKRVAPPPSALSSESEEEPIAAPDDIVIETVPQPGEASETRLPSLTEVLES